MSSQHSQLGTTRNRTDKYVSYRKAAHRGAASLPLDDGAAGTRLLEAALDSAAGTPSGNTAFGSLPSVAAGLPPRWVDVTNEVRDEIRTIQSKMGELKTIYGKTLLTTFDDHHPDEATIEVITADITRRFRKAQGRLKLLNETPGSAEDVKVRTNVQRSLAMEVSQLSQTFRKQQKAYLAKMRQTKETASGSDPFEQQGLGRATQGGWNWSDDEEDGNGGGAAMSTSQVQIIDNMGAMVEERDQEITNVLQSINDLAQIMQDLSVMVIDQGTILDRIDYNMEQVSVAVEEGVSELKKAHKKQKTSCRIICIMFLAVAVIVMSILLMLKKWIFG